jgi:hypothetical protein
MVIGGMIVLRGFDVECSGAEHWSVPGDELQHQVQRAVQQDLL